MGRVPTKFNLDIFSGHCAEILYFATFKAVYSIHMLVFNHDESFCYRINCFTTFILVVDRAKFIFTLSFSLNLHEHNRANLRQGCLHC